MFNWFWRFLYSISQILYELIDGLMSIANKLCGIEPILVDGKETDFLSYLLTSDKITYGFVGATFCALFLIMIFSVFSMMKAVKADSKLTPGQAAVRIIKTMGLFLCVPALMIIFTKLVNELMILMYTATSHGANTMGDFLFRSFLPSGMSSAEGAVNYSSTASVEAFMETYGYDLEDYRFVFSWICCIPLLFVLAKGLLNFVYRTISIILLYIVSPFSISSSVVDDGSHFKLWRDQILVQFLTGYGIIIGLNIYVLIISLITQSNVEFFDNGFLDFLFKIAFALGGAISLDRVMALVGNLVQAGAGSSELREADAGVMKMRAFGRAAMYLPSKMANSASEKIKSSLGGGGGGGVGGGARKASNYASEGTKSSKNIGGSVGGKETQQKVRNAILGGGDKEGNGRDAGKENKGTAGTPLNIFPGDSGGKSGDEKKAGAGVMNAIQGLGNMVSDNKK